MATFPWINAHFTFNSIDLSPHVKSITFSQSAAMLDDTAMGDTAVSVIKGLEADTIQVEFNSDFAAGAVDATLSGVGVGGSAAFILRPDTGAKAATNPEWTGTAFLESYEPFGGTVGDLGGASASLVVSGGSTRGV